MKSTIACKNWDSFNPQKLHNENGKCIGILMPRAEQHHMLFGIQKWSKPETETRKRSDP